MKVLVADHTGALAPTCIIFLAYWGHDVEVVPDGQAALCWARAWRPDLVLAAVDLPKLDGLSLLSAIRAGGGLPRTAVVLAGAAASEHARRRARSLGADGWLETPVVVSELARVVRPIEEALATGPRRAIRHSGAA